MSIEAQMIDWQALEDRAFELRLSSAGYHAELDMDKIDPKVAKLLLKGKPRENK